MTSALTKFKRPLSNWFEGEYDEGEMLFGLARQEGVSELEIVKRAARVWNRQHEVDKVFVKYIHTDELPWWVKHYVRQQTGRL